MINFILGYCLVLKAKWDLWNIYHPEEQQVMVLNDEALKHLNIRNVTCLIHYDLPLPNPKHSSKIRSSCYQGAERFICMWDNIRSIAIEKSNPSLTSKCNKAVSFFVSNWKILNNAKLTVFTNG